VPDRDTSALQPVQNVKPYNRVRGIHPIERFFRVAASLGIEKEDIRRYYEFVDQNVEDLLLVARQTAKANGHVVVELRDIPITKGLQGSIHEFESLDVDVGLERLLEESVPEPLSDLAYSDEVEARLPLSGLSLAVARTFTIIDPQIKHPPTTEWERGLSDL
jgi:Domain of unknown function (DUF1931)